MNSRLGNLLESFLFAFGLALFATGVACIALNVPVGAILFGWVDRFELAPIGKASLLSGFARRKVATQSDFLGLSPGNTIYNFDTIMTDPDSSATLQLEDGSTLELGPRTMIKIEFTPKSAEIRVTRGMVKTRPAKRPLLLKSVATAPISEQSEIDSTSIAEPEIRVEPAIETIAVTSPSPIPVAVPVPSPTPLPKPSPTLRIVKRAPIEKIPFSAEAPTQRLVVTSPEVLREYPLEIRWKPAKVSIPAQVQLFDLKTGAPLKSMPADLSKYDRAKIAVARPGNYEWRVLHQDKVLFKKTVVVPTVVDGLIDPLDPLISGQKTRSTEYNGVLLKDLSLTLRWKSKIPLKKYRLRIFKHKDPKPFHEGFANDETYVLKKQNVPSGKIFYQIDGTTSAGYWIRSPLVPFQFDYVPPIPMNPQSKQMIRIADLESKSLLFTWRKTNFTEFYELEVASDVDFEHMVHRAKTPDNFYTEAAIKPGHYFWRVRSYANGVYSPATPASEFTLK